MIKNSLITTFFVVSCFLGHAKEVYVAKETLPAEFQLLISTLGEYPIDESESISFDKKIANLDRAFQNMDIDSRNFLLKTEIIKWLLDKSKSKVTLRDIQTDTVIRGRIKFEKEKTELTSLAIWFIKSLHDDLEILLSSSHFPTLIKKLKRKSKIQDKALFKIKKQLSILMPSYIHYLETPAEDYVAKQQSVVKSLLDHLESYTSYYLKLSNKSLSTDPNLKFFSKVTFLPKNKEKDVLEILASVKITEANNIKTDNDWLPREDLALFPTPDPDYLAPQKLPSPIEDWAHNGKALLLQPNPYYIAPKNLPLPIKNWVEIAPPKPQASPDPDTDWILE